MSKQYRLSRSGGTGETGPDRREFTSCSGESSSSGLREWIARAQEKKKRIHPRGSSSVLIPILIRDGAFHVLYEVRSSKLHTQPGEVCFPGGRIETGRPRWKPRSERRQRNSASGETRLRSSENWKIRSVPAGYPSILLSGFFTAMTVLGPERRLKVFSHCLLIGSCQRTLIFIR